MVVLPNNRLLTRAALFGHRAATVRERLVVLPNNRLLTRAALFTRTALPQLLTPMPTGN